MAEGKLSCISVSPDFYSNHVKCIHGVVLRTKLSERVLMKAKIFLTELLYLSIIVK